MLFYLGASVETKIMFKRKITVLFSLHQGSSEIFYLMLKWFLQVLRY